MAQIEYATIETVTRERREPSSARRAFLYRKNPAVTVAPTYFGGAGVNISRLLGSGFGLGFGAFFTSLRPLSLFPIGDSLP